MAEITIPRESPLKIPTLMRAHWSAKEPFHLVGEPSTVKSALIKQTAKEICAEDTQQRTFVEWSRTTIEKKKEVLGSPKDYFIFEDLRASETDIGELRLQDMHKDQNYITYKYNLLFVVLSNPDSKGVLFFDEMNLASNMVKAQFYKVYNDRSIGDLPLSDNILIISAGNESSQVRDVVQDSVALTTRRANYFISPLSAHEFIVYGLKTNVHQSIIGYLSFAPQDVQDLKFDLVDPIGQPCVRTWEKFSNVLNSNDKELGLDVKTTIARGFLGPATAVKYMAYAKMENAIRIEDVIKEPEIMKKVKDIQIVYTIVSGLLSRYNKGEDKLFPVICQVASYVKEEIGVYMLRLTKQTISPNKFKKLATDTYAESFDMCVSKFGDLLRD